MKCFKIFSGLIIIAVFLFSDLVISTVLFAELPTYEEWIKESDKTMITGQSYKRSGELQGIDNALKDYLAGKNRENLNKLWKSVIKWEGQKTQDGEVRSRRKDDVKGLKIKIIEKSREMRSEDNGTWNPVNGNSFTAQGEINSGSYKMIINSLTPGNSGSEYRDKIQADPAKFSENKGIISTSYISNTYNTLWAPSGYILKVPKESIIATGGNLMSNNQLLNTTLENESTRLYLEYGIQAPSEILVKFKNNLNEIAITKDGLEVIGIFIVKWQDKPAYKYYQRLLDGSNKDIKIGGRILIQDFPMVTDTWMENYRKNMNKKGIPVIWITPAGSSKILCRLDSLFDGVETTKDLSGFIQLKEALKDYKEETEGKLKNLSRRTPIQQNLWKIWSLEGIPEE